MLILSSQSVSVTLRHHAETVCRFKLQQHHFDAKKPEIECMFLSSNMCKNLFMYLHIKLKLNKNLRRFHSLQMFLFSQEALVYMFTKTVTQCLCILICVFIYFVCLAAFFVCFRATTAGRDMGNLVEFQYLITCWST